MTTSPFVFHPHDVPPEAVETPPVPSITRDYFPIGEFTATAAKVAKFGSFTDGLDDHVPCRVSYFKVHGTFVYLFHSDSRPPSSWLIFADMTSCVVEKQVPTKLATSFIRCLSAGKIELTWKNNEADSVYRSRLRSLEARKTTAAIVSTARVPSKAREVGRSTKTDLKSFVRRSISGASFLLTKSKAMAPAAKRAAAKKPAAKKAAAKKR
jgi:hypothetical protein